MEINKVLANKIIKSIILPWCAQVVVVKDKTRKHRKRLCVDYLQIINLYTEPDVYLLLRIINLITKLGKYKYFSTFELKSACICKFSRFNS